jgi:hypothetical protein
MNSIFSNMRQSKRAVASIKVIGILSLLLKLNSSGAQTTYSGNSIFTGTVTVKSPPDYNPAVGQKNAFYLDAGNYNHNSSTFVFTKSEALIGQIGTDIWQNSEKNMYFQAGDLNLAPIYFNPYGGNVGVGTTYAPEKLSVDGNVHLTIGHSIGSLPTFNNFSHNGNLAGNYSLGWYNDADGGDAPVGYYSSWGGIKFFTTGANRMFISPTGTVGIGTTQVYKDSCKLYVEGTIRARKIKVDAANWADYVFEPNYQLRSLASLKKFISVNKHLPGVPSAKEVKKKGIDLASSQTLLLQKVEELTLYVLKQQDEIDALKKKVYQAK